MTYLLIGFSHHQLSSKLLFVAEYKTKSDDLGSRFKNVAFKYIDRYMVIDCKVPSASFARKTFQLAMLLDADEELDGELSDDSGSVPIFGPRHVRPAHLR